MLIPNKFNGYSRDGIRKYNIGGGVGEMALLDAVLAGAGTGAAVGGVSSLMTGKDPMEGILRGGLMGGATGGLFNGLGGAAAATEGAGAEQVFNPTTGAAMTPTQVASSMPDLYPGGVLPPANTSTMLMPNSAALNATNQSLGIPNAAPAPSASFLSNMTDKQKMLAGGAGIMGLGMLSDRNKYGVPEQKPYTGPLSRFKYDPSFYKPSMYAEGGITSLGGSMMVGNNRMPAPNQYSQDGMGQQDLAYATSPTQSMAHGGISSLGGYSDGGHLLKGPGDGMSDSIPASIAGKRPARLATDEFVVPADVVSHLGNGSSDAGAKQLYSMMNKVRKARTGRSAQGRQINPSKYMPA